MKLSALPGIPKPPLAKKAEDGTIELSPITIEPPRGSPWWGIAGGLGGLGLGGYTGGKISYDILKELGSRMAPGAGGLSAANIRDILAGAPTALGIAQTKRSPIFSALESQLKQIKQPTSPILKWLAGAGAKPPGYGEILTQLRSAPILKRNAGLSEWAARQAARQFAGKRRGFLSAYKRIPGKGRKALLALIPLLLGGIGAYTGYRLGR